METSILQRRVTRLIRSVTASGAALLATAALMSCGGDDESEEAGAVATPDDARVAVREYFAAFARGDGRTVCSLLTDAGRKGMTQLPEGERAGSCPRAVTVLARNSIPVRRPQLSDFAVSSATATAEVTSKDPPYQSGVLLRRDSGGWKIAYPPAVLSKFDSPPGIRPHEE